MKLRQTLNAQLSTFNFQRGDQLEVERWALNETAQAGAAFLVSRDSHLNDAKHEIIAVELWWAGLNPVTVIKRGCSGQPQNGREAWPKRTKEGERNQTKSRPISFRSVFGFSPEERKVRVEVRRMNACGCVFKKGVLTIVQNQSRLSNSQDPFPLFGTHGTPRKESGIALPEFA